MDPFDFYSHFTPMRKMMQISGSWPKSNPSLIYTITGHVSWLILTLFTVSTAMSIYTDFGNVANVIYAMCIVLAAFHSIIKHRILLTNKDKFYKLLGILQNPIFTSHGDLNIYLSQKMRSCTKGRLLFLYSTAATAMLIAVSPLFGISDRKIPAPFPLDMKEHSLSIYISVWIFQVTGTFVTAWIIPGYDGLIVFLIGIAAAELKILRERIIHSTDRFLPNSHHFDALINRRLRACVIHHVTIERYIQLIENMFMVSFLIQVLVSLIITVFVGVNFIITPVTSPEFGRSFFFFLAVIIELTLFCVPGNEIILQSQKIRDACYLSQWTECGPTSRRTLCIIMERAKRPFSLSAAKFVVLSLQSLLAVLKSSFSYFTVLRQMYTESNSS